MILFTRQHMITFQVCTRVGNILRLHLLMSKLVRHSQILNLMSLPAAASTNGIPLSLDQAFGDYSNVQQKSSTLESDAPPGPHAGDSLSGTNNRDADSFYTVKVSIPGSLGTACDFENSCVYI